MSPPRRAVRRSLAFSGSGSLLLLLLLAQQPSPSCAALTQQEAKECRAHPELLAFEQSGGVVLEIALMAYVIVLMWVLIEEYYVPALELMCTKEVLNIPKPIVGCTIMAAGNCLPELSISLVSILGGGQDIGTGEVLGSCVFDLLALLGIVCTQMPREGVRIPLPLMLYFLAWVGIATTTDLLLFFTTAEITWIVACVMVLLYVLFVTGVVLLNALFDLSEAGGPDVGGGGHLDVDDDAEAAAEGGEGRLALPEPAAKQPGGGGGGGSGALSGGGSSRRGGRPGPVESSPLLPNDDAYASAEMAAAPAGGGGGGGAQGWLLTDYDPAGGAPASASAVDGAAPAASGGSWGVVGGAFGGVERRCCDCWGCVRRAALLPARFLFSNTVPKPDKLLCFGRRRWPLTVAMCILYTLGLSFAMVTIASRSICLLGVRKNALGATELCLAAGLPDLITVLVLCSRPGSHMMAASNAFGAFAFNGFVALGLPWVFLGLYTDVFPPARGTWFPGMVGFGCIGVALFAILLCRLELHRNLGVALLLLYVFYLVTVIHDGTTRPQRPPE